MVRTKTHYSDLHLRIGSLFMAGMPGPRLDAGTESLIRDFGLGGVILFSRNIQDPIQLAELCLELQERAMEHHGLPLFLAVDQEGGRVSRLVEPFTSFEGNEAIGVDSRPLERAEEFAKVTAREMTLVGLNMNLAPVMDVRRGEPEKHLVGRMFSDDPETVSALGKAVIRTLQKNGVLAVAKHFPGLGKAPLDPHHRLPTIHSDLTELDSVDLVPFKAAIQAGVSGIMTSHAVYPVLDRQPATISEDILTGVLRQRLGFKGLIITDDLEMGAISGEIGTVEGASMAFGAGADILLICQNQAVVIDSIRELGMKLTRGEIPIRRLEESVDRMMTVKSRFLQRRKKVSLQEVRAFFA